MTDPTTLLAAYDDQLRGPIEATGAGVPTSTDGPVVRVEYPWRGCVSYRSLEGLSGEELDALIVRQRDYFAAMGQAVEWKTRSHDRPADLPERLTRAGFVAEEAETVVIAEAEAIASAPQPPDGVRLRIVDSPADLAGIAAMESAVWEEDWSWLADDLAKRVAADPDDIDIFVAEAGRESEAGSEIVSAAWIVYRPGTDFAGLWGGSTLPRWRRRGIYRALVAARARRAVDRGFRYLQVDASDDSSPVLQRLGFVAVTQTTPYVHTPAD